MQMQDMADAYMDFAYRIRGAGYNEALSPDPRNMSAQGTASIKVFDIFCTLKDSMIRKLVANWKFLDSKSNDHLRNAADRQRNCGGTCPPRDGPLRSLCAEAYRLHPHLRNIQKLEKPMPSFDRAAICQRNP